MNKKSHWHSGFTLIEVFVAIVIFFVVISILFSSFRAFMLSSEAASGYIRNNEMISAASSRIHRDLTNVFSLHEPQYKKPSFDSDPDPFRLAGGQENVGGRTVSFISFASTAHAVLGRDTRRGVARISYYVKENTSEKLDLYRSDHLLPFEEIQTSCGDPVLYNDLSGFEIVYVDEDGDQHEDWDSESDSFDYSFPRQIMIRLITGTGETPTVHVVSSSIYSGRPSLE